jgi:hypothetical protein
MGNYSCNSLYSSEQQAALSTAGLWIVSERASGVSVDSWQVGDALFVLRKSSPAPVKDERRE